MFEKLSLFIVCEHGFLYTCLSAFPKHEWLIIAIAPLLRYFSAYFAQWNAPTDSQVWLGMTDVGHTQVWTAVTTGEPVVYTSK